LGGSRFILEGLEKNENKRYSSVLIGPRKIPFSFENGNFLGKEKKVCFKRCVWKVGNWERQFGRGD
jgi:hypothetical protein